MSMKKLAVGVASVVTLLAGSAIAGGPAHCKAAMDQSGIYVGVDVGGMYNSSLSVYARENDNATDPFIRDKRQTPWAWTAAFSLGYQLNNHWGVQVGYIWNQTQRAEVYSAAATVKYTRYKSHNWYAAIRAMFPVYGKFGAYMLAGAANTSVKRLVSAAYTVGAARDNSQVRTTKNWWSPMGALGVTYAITDVFYANAQWMYIMSQVKTNDSTTVASEWGRLYQPTQRITFGLNYLIEI